MQYKTSWSWLTLFLHDVDRESCTSVSSHILQCETALLLDCNICTVLWLKVGESDWLWLGPTWEVLSAVINRSHCGGLLLSPPKLMPLFCACNGGRGREGVMTCNDGPQASLMFCSCLSAYSTTSVHTHSKCVPVTRTLAAVMATWTSISVAKVTSITEVVETCFKCFDLAMTLWHSLDKISLLEPERSSSNLKGTSVSLHRTARCGWSVCTFPPRRD